jgi:L-cysteine desulfidase
MDNFKKYYQIILNIDNDKIVGLNQITNNLKIHSSVNSDYLLTNEDIIKSVNQVREIYINKCIELLEENYNLQNSVEGNSFLKLILYPLINI